MKSIILDIRRKLPSGEIYIEPVSFFKHEIKGIGPYFSHSCILFRDPINKRKYIEGIVNMPYPKLKELIGDLDVFEKVKII